MRASRPEQYLYKQWLILLWERFLRAESTKYKMRYNIFKHNWFWNIIQVLFMLSFTGQQATCHPEVAVIVRSAPGVVKWIPTRKRTHVGVREEQPHPSRLKYCQTQPSPTNTNSPPLLLFLLSVSVSVKCSLWPQLTTLPFPQHLHWGNTQTHTQQTPCWTFLLYCYQGPKLSRRWEGGEVTMISVFHLKSYWSVQLIIPIC